MCYGGILRTTLIQLVYTFLGVATKFEQNDKKSTTVNFVIIIKLKKGIEKGDHL